jgi:uncharacterized protein (DUF2141 family)
MRVISCAIAFGIIVLLGACAGQAADEAGEAGGAAGTELRITVEGIRSAHGTVLIGLYDSAVSFDRAIELAANDGFLNDPQRVAGIALKANAAMMSGVALPNLPPGRYGAIVFQDENGNGRLDKNFWGVPTEPYGFSNNVQGALGPPASPPSP